MINVVVVTHGDFGEALVRAAEMIVGPQENVRAVALLPEEGPDGFGDKLDAALADLDGQDTLLLIDLFGGTPCNVSSRKVLQANTEVITGMNMAMVIEALTSRDGTPLSELAVQVADAGRKAVVNLKPLLCKKQKGGD
jgi:mannose/fructose/sorbose-specific phosphotransferase system IIA component